MKKEITLPLLVCKRCEHDWHPKEERLPKRCPKCGSCYWNEDRKNGN